MRPLKLLPFLMFSVSAQAQAQTTDAQEAAARALLFQTCGAVESGTLPTTLIPGVYRGTLGGKPITLELIGKSSPDGDARDRYSYDRYGVDISLERGRAANRTARYALAEVEAVRNEDDNQFKARGCFDLSADGQHLKGQWRTPDGSQRFALTLSKVDVAAQPLRLPASPGLLALRTKDPYTFLKVNRPWVQIAGGVREPLSGVTYPHLPAGTTRLNLALQDHQLAMVTDALDCLSNFENRDGHNDYSGAGTLSWKSAGLVSLHEDVDLYCGGAHPDNYTEGVTLDARTGQAVTLLGKSGTLWSRLNVEKLQALYLARYPVTDTDEECKDEVGSSDGADTKYGFPYALYLSKQGLTVVPNYLPHVATACAEAVTLPYSSLREFANPASPYFRDVYPR